MLPLQFFGQNLHFALNLFFSLVAFATFWLYFDAWLASRKKLEIFKWLGFGLISVSFLFQAVTVEQEILGTSNLSDTFEFLALTIRFLGYASVIAALLFEPLQAVPNNQGLKMDKLENRAVLTNFFPGVFKFLLPVGAFTIAFMYYRKATTGMERHLKTVSLAFACLALVEVASMLTFFRDSNNINIYNLVRSFGPVWMVEQALLFFATILLGRWVWSYLVKRLQSQLFIIFTTTVLLIFLLISVSFTFLLVKNVENQTLNNLETASKVLSYSLDSKKAELSAIAQVFSKNPEVGSAVVSVDHNKLISLIEASLENKPTSSITILSSKSMVLARGDEPDSWGDSLSSDVLIQKALEGESQTSIASREDPLTPNIMLQSVEPILKDSKVVGAVLVALPVSNNFLDGIKSQTGLDSAVYTGNLRSATTLLASDQKSRWVGVSEENQAVKKQVLEEGKTFKGSLSLVNKPFLAVYQPLTDVNNQVVGMIFTGEPEVLLLRSAGASIELIFLLAVVLLVLSVIPAYFISKYITYQLS